jgi:hypothetical protein
MQFILLSAIPYALRYQLFDFEDNKKINKIIYHTVRTVHKIRSENCRNYGEIYTTYKRMNT